MKSHKRLLLALSGIAMLLAFAACQKDDDNNDQPPAPPQELGPLCFTALEDSTFIYMNRYNRDMVYPDLEYSFDGINWQPCTY